MVRGELSDEPLRRAGEGAAAHAGEQAGSNGTGLAAATRPDDRDEATGAARAAQAGEQPFDDTLAAEEVRSITFSECLETLVGVDDEPVGRQVSSRGTIADRRRERFDERRRVREAFTRVDRAHPVDDYPERRG